MISNIGMRAATVQWNTETERSVCGSAKETQKEEDTLSREEFRAQFYADAAKIMRSPTVSYSAVQVSDEAVEAMQADAAYRDEMLQLIARDLGSSYAPGAATVVIQIGATSDEYRAHSWSSSAAKPETIRRGTDKKKNSSKEYWDRQKEFELRRRAEYWSQHAAMEANARKYAAESAWRQRHPDDTASRAVLSYESHSTTAVFEGFSLWEGGAMQL